MPLDCGRAIGWSASETCFRLLSASEADSTAVSLVQTLLTNTTAFLDDRRNFKMLHILGELGVIKLQL